MVLRNVIRNKYFSVACEQYIWIVIGFRHSPIPPTPIEPNQKTAAFHRPSKFPPAIWSEKEVKKH